MNDDPIGMPTEDMNLWRLLKQIQGWANTVIVESHDVQIRGARFNPQRMMEVGRRIDAATDLAFKKLQATRKEIDPDF